MLLKQLSVAVACLSMSLWADPVMVVSKVNAGTTLTPSKTHKYEPTLVLGYDDNPDLFQIFRDPLAKDFDIQLTRSFAKEIRENVDKETIERVVQ